MIIVLIAAGCLIVLFGIALTRSVDLTVAVRIEQLAVHLTIAVHYSRIHKGHTWKIPVRPPLSAHTEASPRPALSLALINRALWAYGALKRLVDNLWKRVRVQHFHLRADVGLPECAQTALWVGRLTELAAWWISCRIAPRAVNPPEFAITPLWDRCGFRCDFVSIIRLRPSDIILALGSALFRYTKGGHHSYGESVQQQHL